MGNCFSGLKKKNKVCPSVDDDDDRDIHQVLSGATDFKQPSPREQADMVRDLKEMGVEPTVGGQGVAFVVNFNDDTSADTPQGVEAEKDVPRKEIVYTDEEEQLMEEILRDALVKERKENAMKMELKMLEAEIVREANMKEKKEKAGQVNAKIHDAAQRRQTADMEIGLEVERDIDNATPGISERRMKVKEMADEARRKAAETRKAREE